MPDQSRIASCAKQMIAAALQQEKPTKTLTRGLEVAMTKGSTNYKPLIDAALDQPHPSPQLVKALERYLSATSHPLRIQPSVLAINGRRQRTA